MKKILVVFNGFGYPRHVLDFAIALGKESGSLLYAVFMQPVHAGEGLQYPFPNDLSFTQPDIYRKELEKEDLKSIEKNIETFKKECKEANVLCKIDKNFDTSLDELIRHTQYADLVIADAHAELGQYSLKDLLTDALCPVVLVPKSGQPPQKIVLSYDGSLSSIYAIKSFSYIFPEWKNKKTSLFSVNPQKNDEPERESAFNDWLGQHFTNLNIHVTKGKVHDELINFIQKDSDKTMIVMGAFGRSGFSRMLHKSLADIVLEETDAFLFITHK